MQVLPTYRNQSIDLLRKSLTGFYMRATLAFNGLTKTKATSQAYSWLLIKTKLTLTFSQFKKLF